MAQYISIGQSSGVLRGFLSLGTTWTLLALYHYMAFFRSMTKIEWNNCVASGKAVDVFVGTRLDKFPGWRFRSQWKCCSSRHMCRWPDIYSQTLTVYRVRKYLSPFPVWLPYKIPVQQTAVSPPWRKFHRAVQRYQTSSASSCTTTAIVLWRRHKGLHLLQRSLRIVSRRQIQLEHCVFALMAFLDEWRNFRQAFRIINFSIPSPKRKKRGFESPSPWLSATAAPSWGTWCVKCTPPRSSLPSWGN